jgi:uncharacterized protein
MNKRESIDKILTSKNFAVAGVSRNKNKFGSVIFKELSDKGIASFPVNPGLSTIMGTECYSNLKSLPEKVEALIIATNSEATVKLVKEAFENGITKIWMQQGAESSEAVQFCDSKGMVCVSKECLFMYLDPVKSIHKFHTVLWKLFGKYHKFVPHN